MPRKGADSQWVKLPPGNLLLQPDVSYPEGCDEADMDGDGDIVDLAAFLLEFD